MSDHSDDTDIKGLLVGILDNPRDDATRLILSDRLEELGDVERAEFIRLQIEDSRIPIEECDSIYPGCEVYDGRVVQHDHKCRGYALRERIRELCGPYNPNAKDGNFYEWFLKDCPFLIKVPLGITISRGFVSEVRLTCAEFCGGPCGQCEGYRAVESAVRSFPFLTNCKRCRGTGRAEGVARELFQKHPIVKVVFNDKRPRESYSGCYLWSPFENDMCRDSHGVPRLIYNWMPYTRWFDTEAEAFEILSDAAVAYGRTLAGLGLLPTAKGVSR